jgi:hypothetical protein
VARVGAELRLAPEQAAEIYRRLPALVEGGFLLSAHRLLSLCRRSTDPPAPPITTLGIPTRNRTQSLERCLRSYLDNAQRHDRRLACVIVDDSDDPIVRRDNQEMLQALEGRHPGAISYAGPEEKASFAEALVRQLPPEDVRFGLLNEEGCPVATGTSRNALLLHAVGEMLLQVDDDTACRLAPAPEARSGLACSSDYDPTLFWFPGEDEPLPSGTADGEPDLLAIHEQLLGKGVSACLAGVASDAELDLARTGASFFRRLESSGGRILATAAGVMGDSGMGSPAYFLSQDGPGRARLLRSETTYRWVLARRRVVRAVCRPTISDGILCMALNLGLDNRDPLPPFAPVQRNQDGVFAALLRACFDGGCFGFLPWLVLHETPGTRRLSPDDFWRSAGLVMSGQILQALVSSFSPGPDKADPCKNLRTLGQSLADWGSAPSADFAELVRILLWNQMSRKIVHLESLLRETQGQPPFWAEDVRRLLALWREVLPDRQYIVPADLVPTFGSDTFGRFQRLVRRFGRFLQIWPDMITAARELRAQGRRLAVGVGREPRG